MLEGLEISEVQYKSVLALSYSQRIDSTYFLKEFLHKQENQKKYLRILDICYIKSGTTPTDRDEDLGKGIVLLKTDAIRNNVLQFQSRNDWFFIDESTNNSMVGSALQAMDVLINIVGATTDVIGRCALVGKSFPKANITQAMALLRIKPDYKKIFIQEYLFIALSSNIGHAQVRRIARPTGQFNMNLQEVGSFEIPVLSFDFQSKIAQLVCLGETCSFNSLETYAKAENLLLETIGMADFTPSSEPVNIKYFKGSFGASGRLDAEYYQSKYDALEINLSKKNRISYLGDLLSINQRGKQPDYADVGLPVVNSKHVRASGVVFDDNRLATFDDKTLLIQYSDVLINGTGVGTIGRAVAYLQDHKAIPDNHVTILRTTKLNPLYLAVYLNSAAGQMQVDKYFKGSSGQIELYPADIAKFLVPLISDQEQQKIAELVQQSFALKAQSEHLLDVAKRAVEIAIEQDEDAALAYITHEVKDGSE